MTSPRSLEWLVTELGIRPKAPFLVQWFNGTWSKGCVLSSYGTLHTCCDCKEPSILICEKGRTMLPASQVPGKGLVLCPEPPTE